MSIGFVFSLFLMLLIPSATCLKPSNYTEEREIRQFIDDHTTDGSEVYVINALTKQIRYFLRADGIEDDEGHVHQLPNTRNNGFLDCGMGSPRYIPLSDACDNFVDCQTAQDELHCGWNGGCSIGELYCGDGKCAEAKKCDGHKDCENGKDELNCVYEKNDNWTASLILLPSIAILAFIVIIRVFFRRRTSLFHVVDIEDTEKSRKKHVNIGPKRAMSAEVGFENHSTMFFNL